MTDNEIRLLVIDGLEKMMAEAMEAGLTDPQEQVFYVDFLVDILKGAQVLYKQNHGL